MKEIQAIAEAIENPTVETITAAGNAVIDSENYTRQIGQIGVAIKDVAAELDPMFGSMTETEAVEKLEELKSELEALLPESPEFDKEAAEAKAAEEKEARRTEYAESIKGDGEREYFAAAPAVHEEEYNTEKKMTLETPASKLLTRLQQVNPDVSLEIAKQLMEASDSVKAKVVEQYGLNETETWNDDVKKLLSI